MVKKPSKEPVIKSIVRGVVREELTQALGQQKVELKSELLEAIDQKFDEKFTSFRDQMFTYLDKAVGLGKKNDEQITVVQGQISDHTDRLEKLESIHPNSQHSFA